MRLLLICNDKCFQEANYKSYALDALDAAAYKDFLNKQILLKLSKKLALG